MLMNLKLKLMHIYKHKMIDLVVAEILRMERERERELIRKRKEEIRVVGVIPAAAYHSKREEANPRFPF